MSNARLCAQCKAADWDSPEGDDYGPGEAEYYVTGTVVDAYSGGRRPYRAYLCRDHVLMLEEDGATLTKQRLAALATRQEA